jgi:hypothetical protein
VFAQEYASSLSRAVSLQQRDDVSLSVTQASCERDIVADCQIAFDCFELGLSRCAMVRYKGWCAEGWDTHQKIELQSVNFHDLFSYLNGVLAAMDGRVGTSGSPLSEEVTIVVFSEMGREPRLNTWGGKDHWTYTSAMLIGAGVAGGRSIGGLDDQGKGSPVDLNSGEISGGGTGLLPSHLGATLLAMGDVDPAAHIENPAVLAAVMS